MKFLTILIILVLSYSNLMADQWISDKYCGGRAFTFNIAHLQHITIRRKVIKLRLFERFSGEIHMCKDKESAQKEYNRIIKILQGKGDQREIH